jgi:hypothetical protein
MVNRKNGKNDKITGSKSIMKMVDMKGGGERKGIEDYKMEATFCEETRQLRRQGTEEKTNIRQRLSLGNDLLRWDEGKCNM